MNTLGDSTIKLVKSKAYNLLLDTTTPISATSVNDTKALLREVKTEFSRRGIPLPDYKPLRVRYAEWKAKDEKARARRMGLFAGMRARSAPPPVAAGGAAGGDPRPVISIPESPLVAAGGAGGGGGGGGGELVSPGLPSPAPAGKPAGKPPMLPPLPPTPPGPKAKNGCAIVGGKRRTKRMNRKKRQSRKM